jgi:hypothetical protein
LRVGGYVSGGVLILFGIAVIVLGIWGFAFTRDHIKQEGIVFGGSRWNERRGRGRQGRKRPADLERRPGHLVTGTALTSARNLGYMGEMLSISSIVVGVALLLAGIGFVILALAVFRRSTPSEAVVPPAPGEAASSPRRPGSALRLALRVRSGGLPSPHDPGDNDEDEHGKSDPEHEWRRVAALPIPFLNRLRDGHAGQTGEYGVG